MKRHLIKILCVSFTAVLGCTNNDKQVAKTMNDYSESADAIKEKVLHGDTVAYKDLRVIYLEAPIAEFLPYCLIMANKYEYPPAFYDVYYSLLTYNGFDLYSLDSLDMQTRKIAVENLILAASNQHENAIDILDSLRIDWKDSLTQ